jgi:UDP-GlcNAc:undecaprenyl-phosphate GlcNAc-1-phosphate transferase
MSRFDWTFLSAPLVAFAATWLSLALWRRLAPGMRLVDAGDAGAGGRKLQPLPVPSVGGPAILCGLAAALLFAGPWGARAPFIGRGFDAVLPIQPQSALLMAALLAAFLVGLVDDWIPGGLSPGRKGIGQCLAGAILAAPVFELSPLWAAAILVAAVAAQNLLNTFDNADGAALTLTIPALCLAAPVSAASLAACLPWNLAAGSGKRARIYLGDSGAHLLGLMILVTPAAWGALVLPALDLGRLVLLRSKLGLAPWSGDRRHLAHRLQERGLGAPAVAGVLLAVALPAIVLGASDPLSLRALAGATLTAGLFWYALWRSRRPHGGSARAGTGASFAPESRADGGSCRARACSASGARG